MPANASENQDSDSDPTRRKIPLRRKLLFSAVTVIVVLASLELLLRLAGFQVTMSVERMAFAFPIDDYNEAAPEPFLARDETVFWRPKPGLMDHNSHGFYGPEFNVAKQPGVFRIVCLGDSCTHFGPNTYPDMLRVYLEGTAPGKFEVINAGVIGYTSFQGRRLLESEVLDWSPDLVTVYFGWNDHWLARGRQDKDQNAESSAVMDALGELRTVQFAAFAMAGLKSQTADVMRVEPDDYRDNLNQIGAQCKSRDIAVWYFTAPHAFDQGIPPYLLHSGEISDANSLIPLHQSYNQTVRDVAAARGVPLIDLAAEMDRMNKRDLFLDDRIHLSRVGRFYVTKRIIETLQATGTLSAQPNLESSSAPEGSDSAN